MELKIKAVSPKIGREIPAPFYATPGSAAMDLHACLEQPITLLPGGRTVIPTGIAIALPSATMWPWCWPAAGWASSTGGPLQLCGGD